MADVEFKMTSAGRDAVTNSAEVRSLCDDYGAAVQSRAANMSGYYYGKHTVYGQHRVHTRVYCTTDACNNDTYDHNTLLKAMGA